MAHPPPFRMYPGQNGAPPPPQNPYGDSRGPPSRQGGAYPRDQYGYDDASYDDRPQRNAPPPNQYPPPSRGNPRGGGPPPQMRRPPREDMYDRRGPPQDPYAQRSPYQNPPMQGQPRKARPPMQALDLAGPPPERPRRRPGADEYVALVSPIYDKRFEDDRRAYPPQDRSPTSRISPRHGPPPGEPLPTMQFNMGAPPPRSKSTPPDDPRNWDRNAPPPPRLQRDPYDDRRPPPQNIGRGGPPSRGGRPPMDRPPPQQMYDRGPDPRRKSPPNQYPPHDRAPPSRSNTFPMPNDNYDPRDAPPPQRIYDPRPSSRQNGHYDPRVDDRGYPPPRDPRIPPPRDGNVNGNVDELLDNYLEELGSPILETATPPRMDPRQQDPRNDPRFDTRGRDPRQPPSPEQYVPLDRRQLAAQAGMSGPPTPGMLPRSQTAPIGISDLSRDMNRIDLSSQNPRARSPNKLHKQVKPQGPIGVQSQTIVTLNGTVDPNALPIFPSPNSNTPTRETHSRESYASDRSVKRKPEKPKLTFALLEEYRRDAKDNPSDPHIQLEFAKALVEAGTVLAQESGMGDPKRIAKSRENYITEAHKIIKKLASSGSTGVGKPPYPDAMYFYATCYGDGSMGLPVDHEKAFNLYFSAAKAGHTGSCYRTAMSCEVGIGTRRDPPKAMQFYRKAASLGDVAAMYKLGIPVIPIYLMEGIIMLRGLLGLPANTREAITWLKRAAENADEENPQGLNVLAKLYEKPDASLNGAIIQDEAYALELYTKGAYLGHPPAQYKLGSCYEYGTLGCVVDPRKSIAWYSRAAEQGDPEGELALSGWYLTGAEGILPQSDQEAFLWAQKAAQKGLAKAEFAVGYYVETGIGTAKDVQEAKRWYLRAAEQGQKRAMARLAELKKMPNGPGNGGGARELQKQRGGGGGGGGKEDCAVM